MNEQEKMKYFKQAANLCGFGFSEKNATLLIWLYELILKKKGKSTIEDIVSIESSVEDLFNDK